MSDNVDMSDSEASEGSAAHEAAARTARGRGVLASAPHPVLGVALATLIVVAAVLVVVVVAVGSSHHSPVSNADMRAAVEQQCPYVNEDAFPLSKRSVSSYVESSNPVGNDYGQPGDRVFEYEWVAANDPTNVYTRAFVYVFHRTKVDAVECQDPTGLTGSITLPSSPPGL
jgi:hypothetical protein